MAMCHHVSTDDGTTPSSRGFWVSSGGYASVFADHQHLGWRLLVAAQMTENMCPTTPVSTGFHHRGCQRWQRPPVHGGGDAKAAGGHRLRASTASRYLGDACVPVGGVLAVTDRQASGVPLVHQSRDGVQTLDAR